MASESTIGVRAAGAAIGVRAAVGAGGSAGGVRARRQGYCGRAEGGGQRGLHVASGSLAGGGAERQAQEQAQV